MVSTKDTVQRVLNHLPEDCSMQQFLDRLYLVNLIEERLKDLDDPNAEAYSTDQVREMIAQWRVK